VTHDVIYAFQDLEDDVKAGIKGMAVRYRNHIDILLWSLATLQIALFFKLSQILSAGSAYFLFAIAGNAVLHAAMIKQVNLEDPDACLWWFQTGCLIFGSTTFAGLFGEYLTRP
jgi:4-hydroxybenzoate polyprenyltransferase